MLLALEQSWPGALLNQGHVIGIIFYSFFFFPSGTTGASCLFAIKHMEITSHQFKVSLFHRRGLW